MTHPHAGPAHPRAADAGFSLLELMVVCGVIAVLFGLGIGYLGKTDPRAIADSVLRGELRSAQWTARAEGLPTEVRVTPGENGAAATVESLLLQPIVTFHLEPRDAVLDESLRPILGGDDVPTGRFGHGRRSKDGDRAPVLRWVATKRAADLSSGFALRLDLWLDRRGACSIAKLGAAVELRLDDEGRPLARFRMRGTQQAAALAQVLAKVALPVRQWCTLAVAMDGREAWLDLDGRELGRTSAQGEPVREDTDTLDVSPGDAPVPGIVDEVRLFAYAFGAPQRLPVEVQPDRRYRIVFDRLGVALGSTEVTLVNLQEERQ